MKICKHLILTGVLALASTGLYAGNSKSSESCSSSRHWDSRKHMTLSTVAERPGYFETSKGLRFCTAKAAKDREMSSYAGITRHDRRDWNREEDASKDRTQKNPS